MTKRESILVVDDEEMVRGLVRRTLEEAGYSVVTAAGGKEALDKMSQLDVSLVLLDTKMPGLDGFQVLDLIRKSSDVPVITLSAIDEVTTLRSALDAGADDYITKPFCPRELVDFA